MNDILILGDSTSMTIGLEQKMYPYVLSDAKSWEKSTRFVNCSQPGFTSADACAFFYNTMLESSRVRGVIIHLGTCDAFRSEITKGRYSLRRQELIKVKRQFGFKPKRSRLKNSLLYYKWNGFIDDGFEKSEDVGDFEFNINRIINCCVKKDIVVVLILPISHMNFPSGVGKGNFIFYRYLGVNDIISHRLEIEDAIFLKALAYQEQKQFRKALDLYKEILLEPEKAIRNSEYQLIIVNNYAVCAAEAGYLDEAAFLFELLLEEDGVRKEIIFYNLACLSKLKSDGNGYKKLLSKSYHVDDAMYRIRQPYQSAINNIYGKYEDKISLINLNEFIDDSQFVDHCHPLPEGQIKLAKNILKCFKQTSLEGSHSATITNKLYNPELAMGNTEEFFTYYRTYSSSSNSDIENYVDILKNIAKGYSQEPEQILTDQSILSNFPKEFIIAIKYHLTHPFFPTLNDLLICGPTYPSDIGRFPEFFFIRFLLPYIKRHEIDNDLKCRFNQELALLRSSEQLNRVLPDKVKPLVEEDIPVSAEVNSIKRVDSVLKYLKQSLLAHTKKGSQIYERMKTTIFWFFRETLRFGPHSRISMRYDRVYLENSAESLAACGVIDQITGGHRTHKIEAYIKTLQDITTIHEQYCSAFDQESDNCALISEYNKNLMEAYNQVLHL